MLLFIVIKERFAPHTERYLAVVIMSTQDMGPQQ